MTTRPLRTINSGRMFSQQALHVLAACGYSEPGAHVVLQYARTGRLYCDDTIHVTADTSGALPAYHLRACDCGISCPCCGETANTTETRVTVSAAAEDYVYECGECGATWHAEIPGTSDSSLIEAFCDCGRKIRAAASTLAAAPIFCQACSGCFQPQNPADA